MIWAALAFAASVASLVIAVRMEAQADRVYDARNELRDIALKLSGEDIGPAERIDSDAGQMLGLAGVFGIAGCVALVVGLRSRRQRARALD